MRSFRPPLPSPPRGKQVRRLPIHLAANAVCGPLPKGSGAQSGAAAEIASCLLLPPAAAGRDPLRKCRSAAKKMDPAQRQGRSKEGRSPLLCRFKDGVQGKGNRNPFPCRAFGQEDMRKWTPTSLRRRVKRAADSHPYILWSAEGKTTSPAMRKKAGKSAKKLLAIARPLCYYIQAVYLPGR